MHLEPYLSFDGTCEEALAFYGKIFGGEVAGMMRFEGTPMADAMPPEQRQRVMHASFKSPTLQFMASDSNVAVSAEPGRITLSLTSHDVAESQRIFDALADGGAVTMPFAKVFWGAMFGMCTDKFGINWMVNAELPA